MLPPVLLPWGPSTALFALKCSQWSVPHLRTKHSGEDCPSHPPAQIVPFHPFVDQCAACFNPR
eukprot:12911085-Prorocentrum_lima.AAC.1